MTNYGIWPNGLGFIITLLLSCLSVFWIAACTPQIERSGPRAADPVLGTNFILTSDNARLPVRIWHAKGDATAIFLALHGFNDHSKSFDIPARFWAERGITTYAYDQRGFGEAPHWGRFADIDTLIADLATTTTLIHDRHPILPLYLLGESMGASVIMAAFASDEHSSLIRPTFDREAFKGIILSAPAIWGRETMNPFIRAALWLGAHTLPWHRVSSRELNIKPSDNIEMLRKLAQDPLVIKETRIDALYGLVNLMDAALNAAPHLKGRALILYGTKEELIPAHSIDNLLKRLPENRERRFARYAKGYHMLLRDLAATEVHNDIAAWIAAPNAPLPSGADIAEP